MNTGAGIFCVVCGARPYPELGPLETREDFDLMRLDRKGRPAESPASGEWFCSRHFERVDREYQVTSNWVWPNEEPAPREATSEPLLFENPSEIGCASPNRKRSAARSKTSTNPVLRRPVSHLKRAATRIQVETKWADPKVRRS